MDKRGNERPRVVGVVEAMRRNWNEIDDGDEKLRLDVEGGNLLGKHDAGTSLGGTEAKKGKSERECHR